MFNRKKEVKFVQINFVAHGYTLTLVNGEVVKFTTPMFDGDSPYDVNMRYKDNYNVRGKTYPRSAVLSIERNEETDFKISIEVDEKLLRYSAMFETTFFPGTWTYDELKELKDSGKARNVKKAE